MFFLIFKTGSMIEGHHFSTHTFICCNISRQKCATTLPFQHIAASNTHTPMVSALYVLRNRKGQVGIT